MKNSLFFLYILFILNNTILSQEYETKNVVLRVTFNVNPSRITAVGTDFPSQDFQIVPDIAATIMTIFDKLTSSYNQKNYRLLTSPNSINDLNGQLYYFVFEKNLAIDNQKLEKLLKEIDIKILNTSNIYIEKAKTEINQNVLLYLKGIPDEVLAKSFKEQLLKNLSIEIGDKLSKIKDEIISELK